MNLSSYISFLLIAGALTLVPGADFAVTIKNTLAGGRTQGRWAAIGVASASAVQGAVAAAGLGAVIVRSQVAFAAIKWAGVAYLVYLGVQALVSAIRGSYPTVDDGLAEANPARTDQSPTHATYPARAHQSRTRATDPEHATAPVYAGEPKHDADPRRLSARSRQRSTRFRQRSIGLRQGFLSNITNPKVLVFYLAILPQFLAPGTPIPVAAIYALSHAVLGLLFLTVLVAALDRMRRFLMRRRVRRSLDGVTGAMLVGFAATLAVEG